MTEFKVEVVKLADIKKHENADTLSCVQVFGQSVIFRTGDFQEGDLAAYVPYDAVVPLEGRFAFLKAKDSNKKTMRIKPIRLRGVYSEGVLVAAPKGAALGQDFAEAWGVVKYVEPEDVVVANPVSYKTGALYKFKVFANSVCWRLFGFPLFETKPGDPGLMPKYDLDHYLREKEKLQQNQEVVVTEKLHGSNFRAVYAKWRLWVASHNVYRNAEDNSIYWRVASKLDLKSKLKKIKGFAVYGEIYGQGVQDLTYSEKDLGFRVFDIFDIKNKEWLTFDEMSAMAASVGLETVPVLYKGPFVESAVEPLRHGKSTLDGKTLREGIVIKTAGKNRVALKYVSEDYKIRNGGSERK